MSESPGDATSLAEDDVLWVCDVLGLPRTAFGGQQGKDPRLEILGSTDTLDIAACPGSGKTTLLVAKLAILARKWTQARRGFCVLSHTNVARREIEKRLGDTYEGKRLLKYPHFVGTIHGFVNEFMAIPWLRSLGYPVRVIDNDHCERYRRRLLRRAEFSALGNYVKQREASGRINVVSQWRMASPAFDVLKISGKPEFKDSTKPAAKQLRSLSLSCLKSGYYRHDEMFMWAIDLLDKLPKIRTAFRARFPKLFMDEVQDNSEEQSALLFRLFMDGDDPVIRQRFGDANQAIYQNTSQGEGATTDLFPATSVCRDMPSSYRFGPEIARLADPLGLKPQNLRGCGPPLGTMVSDTSGKHTIFLFGVDQLAHVIRAYAAYLLEVFSEQELKDGIFTAVGGVHRPGSEDNMPRCVAQYWSEYDHELANAEPRPGTLIQYIAAGLRLSEASGEAFHVVDKFADGLLSFARLKSPAANFAIRRRKHRYVLELLANHVEARVTYLKLVTLLAVKGSMPTRANWENRWRTEITRLAEVIGGGKAGQEGSRFLDWQGQTCANEEATMVTRRDNIFRYPTGEAPRVQVRVGSIHSVKGETHTATLVMETFYHGHHLAALRPWLLGQRAGGEKEGVFNTSRLKQHYVAMTRPTHLLCLAMREDGLDIQEMDRLKNRGWRLARVTDGAPQWL